MGRLTRARRLIARATALAAAAVALAHCSGPFTSDESRYSPRVVEEGEPVPKGGGVYRVGSPYQLNGRTYTPSENTRYRGEGVASWYGPDFHGRLTANGEVFDMHSISAAHPTMPLPSYARVTNLDNGRSIIVRVNDRGPFSRNRVIDVSTEAAKALQFYGHGLARVRVEYVGRAPLEGSDDRMLLATLREGSPAPAPSKVMLASAAPFVPQGFGESNEAPPTPPSTIRLPERAEASANTYSRSATPQRVPQVRSAVAPVLRSDMGTPATPIAGFAAPREDALALMSGRGLY